MSVRWLPDGITTDTDGSQTLLELAVAAGIPHSSACGGDARCSTCRVLVVSGDPLTPRTGAEAELAATLDFSDELRLSCQARATGVTVVRRLVLDPADIDLTDHRTRREAGRVGREQDVAILFADIRGFTAFSEALLPYDVIHILNRFFALANDVVTTHGGAIGAYLGDGFMALFGHDIATPAQAAVHAGLALIDAVDDFQAYVAPLHDRRFGVSIGVHYGRCVVGEIGAGPSRTVTAIGDAVNTAARVEHANREFDTRMLVSAQVHDRLAGAFDTVPQQPIELAGKAGTHVLYAVKGAT